MLRSIESPQWLSFRYFSLLATNLCKLLEFTTPSFLQGVQQVCSAIRKNTSHLLAVWYPPALCDSFCSSIGRESEQSLLALNLPLRCCRPYLFQPTVQVFSPLKSHSLLRWSFLEAIQLLSFLAGLL